ncbi:MAG: hypothetical protein J2P23_05820 [Microlunatus sp.]|nr:hypothetical protein [Microlunatus sp.]
MSRRPLARLVALAAAATSTAALALAGAAIPAHAGSDYIEPGPGDDPVTAQPEVTRPATRHCTVTLADHFLSNAADDSPQDFSGTLTPPAACPGPWAKVVLDYTTSVSGRQYDRSGGLQVGGATIWFGTTQEPGGDTPTTFHFAKDVTRYSALFRRPEPYSGGYGNYKNSTYTGNYDQTVTLTFYTADAAHPAPAVPDAVLGVPVPDLNPGHSSADVPLPTLPRNLTRADLEVTLKGNGCDEQWFAGAPDDVAAAFPGVCAAGPYREATFGLDGTPAGAVGTYPHIYSGGIVPTLWRPVLAIDTLDLRPENLDLTPFVGRLVDGGSHTLNVSISPLNDNWNVVATLFLYTDKHSAQTSGTLITDDVSAAKITDDHHATGNGDEQAYDVSASRTDKIIGYVDTSAGRVYTTTSYDRTFAQTGAISDGGLVQSIKQTDRVRQTSVSTLGSQVLRSSTLDETYPLSMSYSAASYVDDNNYSLVGTVDMGQQVSSVDLGSGEPVRRKWNWTVDSYGIQARAAGVISAKDGHSTTTYVGTDDLGRGHNKTIITDHGLVVRTIGR